MKKPKYSTLDELFEAIHAIGNAIPLSSYGCYQDNNELYVYSPDGTSLFEGVVTPAGVAELLGLPEPEDV